MLRAEIVVVSVLASLAACKKPPDPWSGGYLAANADRSAFVFWRLTEVVLLRGGNEQRTVRFTRGSCLDHGEDIDLIVVTPDGWHAYVVGARSDGALGFEHSPREITVACVVDFQAGTSWPLESEIPWELGLTDDEPGRGADVGAVSGRVYTWSTNTGLRVFDPATKQIAQIPLNDLGILPGCQLGENRREAVFACGNWRRATDSSGVTVSLARISLSAWPPTTALTEIEVPADPTSFALSSDGSTVAIWRNGPGGYLRINEVANPRAAVEVDRNGQVVNAVAFDHDRVYAEVSIATEAQSEWIRILDRQGNELRRFVIREAAATLYPFGQSILLDRGSEIELVHLPKEIP